jgi:hypothetical protein
MQIFSQMDNDYIIHIPFEEGTQSGVLWVLTWWLPMGPFSANLLFDIDKDVYTTDDM